MMDSRITALTPWQRVVYDLCWKCGASQDEEAGRILDRMKKERPKEFERAFEVWEKIMFEVLY